jgi:hypothetical protein
MKVATLVVTLLALVIFASAASADMFDLFWTTDGPGVHFSGHDPNADVTRTPRFDAQFGALRTFTLSFDGGVSGGIITDGTTLLPKTPFWSVPGDGPGVVVVESGSFGAGDKSFSVDVLFNATHNGTMFHATGTRVTAAAAEPLSMTLVGAAMFAAGWVRRRR